MILFPYFFVADLLTVTFSVEDTNRLASTLPLRHRAADRNKNLPEIRNCAQLSDGFDEPLLPKSRVPDGSPISGHMPDAQTEPGAE